MSRKTALLNKKLTSVSMLALASLMMAGNAQAAALTVDAGLDVVANANDTWDIHGNAGGTGAFISFDSDDNDVDTKLTITSSNSSTSAATLSGVSVDGDGDGDDTNTMVVGNGTNAVTLTLVSISGNHGTAAADMLITIDAENGASGTGNSAMVISGNVDIDTGSISLDDEAADLASASITFNGTAAQTVAGAIKGTDAGDGNINITNTHASGVTFSKAIGGTTVNNIKIGSTSGNTGSVAVFSSTVGAAGIITVGADGDTASATTSKATFSGATTATGGFVFGEAAGGTDTTDTNTIVFSVGGDYTVTGAFSAADAADTNNLNITGSNTATFASAIAGVDTLTIGSADGANGLAAFRGNVTATSIVLGDSSGNGGNTITVTVDTQGGSAIGITGTVAGVTAAATDTITLALLDGNDGLSALTTFNSAVGGSATTTRIDALTVGSATKSGLVTFGSTYYGATIAVTGGNIAAEDSKATFSGNTTATTIVATGTAGGGTADLVFGANLTATSITLDDDTGVLATVTFNGSSAQTIAGTVVGAVGDDGTLVVTNTNDASGATFSSIIGGGGANIGTLQIGSTADALEGTATFSAAVTAATLTMAANGAAINDDINATFNGLTTITNDVTLTAGDAASEDINATFTSGLVITGDNLTMNDDVGVVTVTFGGSATYTVAAKIDGAANGEGTIVINNTGATSGVTFSDEIGKVGVTDVAAVKIGTTDGANSIATFNDTMDMTAMTLGNGGSTADTDTARFVVGAAEVITGTINGSSVDTSNVVVYSSANNIAHTTTFASIIGGSTPISSLTIGDTTAQRGGKGIFSSAVSATAITITAADTNDALAAIGDFNGAVTGTTITVTAGGANAEDASATFAGDVTVTSVTLNDEDGGGDAVTAITFDGAAAQAVTGTIDGSADGEGAVTVTNSHASGVTFNSNIGSTHDLLTFTVDGNAAGADAFAFVKGGIQATNITLNDNGGNLATIDFTGTSTQTVDGDIDGSADGEGTLEISNSVTFLDDIGSSHYLAAINVDASKTMKMGISGSTTTLDTTAVAVSGYFNPLDTVQLGANTTMTFNTGSRIVITDETTVSSTTAFIDADTNNATVALAAAATVTVVVPDEFRTGTINLIDANGGATFTLGAGAAFSIADTVLTDYTVTNTSGLVTVTAEEKSAATTAEELDVSVNGGAALAAGYDSTVDDSTVNTAYETALTTGGLDAQKAAEQSANASSTLASTTTVTTSTGSASIGAAATHLAALRDGGANYASNESGVSAGRAALANAVWAKPFYNNISQDDVDNVAGYDAQTGGAALGVDVFSNDVVTTGVSISYARTSVDGNGLGRDETDIDSYQVSIYGQYNVDKWYLDGYAAYARNEAETERHIDFGGLDRIAKGDFSGDQYMAKLGAGLPYAVGQGQFITPMASFLYAHVENDSYTETGAGVLNLEVDPDAVNVFQGSLGARYHAVISHNGGKLIPEIHANLLYDFAGDEATSTSTFTGGGSTFEVTGTEAEQFGGNAGVGLTYDIDNVSVSAGYDAELRQDFVGHTGTLEARFKF